ncbi:MAG: Omp28-related outer membrane protein [Bacteroidia bacterium]
MNSSTLFGNLSIRTLKKRGGFYLLLLLSFLATGKTPAQARHKVLVEEFTGMWCGDCPRGKSACEHLDSVYGNAVICISLHNNDSLSSPYSDQLAMDCGVSQFPIAFVDRTAFNAGGGVFQFMDETSSSWDPAVADRLKNEAPVDLIISSHFDTPSRLLSTTLKLTAETLLNKHMRLNCVLVEDSIETDLKQMNFGNADHDSPWFEKGNPIRHYVQRNVARVNLSGNWGEDGILPQKMNAGETILKSYSYTIPDAWKAGHMKILAFVTEWNDAGALVDTSRFSVLNAEIEPLFQKTISVQSLPSTSNSLKLAPNPFSSSCEITYSVEESTFAEVLVYAPDGRKVAVLEDGATTAGEHRIVWDGTSLSGNTLPGGMYIVRIQTAHYCDSRLLLLNR